MSSKQEQLFQRTYNLESEINMLMEDLKELKSEFTYHAEHNASGLDKNEVKKIMKAAKAKVKMDNLREKAEELNEIAQIQEMYS